MRRLPPKLRAASVLTAAALLATGTAFWAAGAIENRSARSVERLLAADGIAGVEVAADGLLVTLSGMVASEAMRFRALSLAGQVVDAARVLDQMEVPPATEIAAPRFSVELLRNEDGISLIGLVPAGSERAAMIEGLRGLDGSGEVLDMLESADFPVPPGWELAVSFGISAVRALPRSKVSIAADRVSVTAISDSAEQRRQIEADLRRIAPPDLVLALAISAPRPVITPFSLRFLIDEEGPRFDACSADTERARARILAAAQRAGLAGPGGCTIGLGVPSPSWGEAAAAAIDALAALGAGTVTIADADITLSADHSVPQDEFDRIVGDLDARLPEVFSLRATLQPAPETEAAAVAPRFTASLSPEGQVQLRGLLPDERMRDAVDAFARARFGADLVHAATRIEDSLPEGWALRVLAGLAALSELGSGTLNMRDDIVELRGISGSQEARERITGILSEHLGQGQDFRVEVSYDPKLDPFTPPPTAQECVDGANAILADGKITFAPGSARIDATARRTLNALADVLRDCIDVPLEIGGHTDSQGRAETNLRLSQQRADAVLQALLSLRVPVGAFTARGYGAAEPVADNATEAGREANRRIEFRVIPDPQDAAGADEEDAELPIDLPERATEAPRARPADGVTDAPDETGETVPGDDDNAGAEPPAAPDAGDVPPAPDRAETARTSPEDATAPETGTDDDAQGLAEATETPYDSAAPRTMTIRPVRRPAER